MNRLHNKTILGEQRDLPRQVDHILNTRRNCMSQSYTTNHFVTACVAILLSVATANAESPATATRKTKIDFARDVFPILRRSCFECHGQDEQEGGLRLDQKADAFDSGTIEPGSPADSELLRRLLLPRGHDEVMPRSEIRCRKNRLVSFVAGFNQARIGPMTFKSPNIGPMLLHSGPACRR